MAISPMRLGRKPERNEKNAQNDRVMTQAEIIQAISDDKMMPFIQPEQLTQIVEFVIKNYRPSLPSDLDEAAFSYENDLWESGFKECGYSPQEVSDAFKAGAYWMAGQGWIDDGSMPPETKQESDTLQGHREWTESEPVLAWDSMYGCRVDWTRNGKWMSEQRGGYAGQICHGIIAWRPIPGYKEKQ